MFYTWRGRQLGIGVSLLSRGFRIGPRHGISLGHKPRDWYKGLPVTHKRNPEAKPAAGTGKGSRMAGISRRTFHTCSRRSL